ncbi:hypothetical protein ERS140147_02436 [Staphylococcus schweitzeri]|uniref:Uncharacterized protein n=1 Tax=Staphylococcus schweitzeri TaxID=1654388 RepID=A0A077ULI9_9STAP|nr:hypothetical protein ERS140147_02436 [Staphylococcus schweitzeri]
MIIEVFIKIIDIIVSISSLFIEAISQLIVNIKNKISEKLKKEHKRFF